MQEKEEKIIKAPSVLLVFDAPDVVVATKNKLDRESWQDAVKKLAEKAKYNTAIRRLGENVLLLPLNDGLQGVVDVVQTLGTLKYKYAILSEDIEWRDGGAE